MRNKNLVLTITLLTVLLGSLSKSYSQATTANGTNFPIGAIEYLGWSTGSNTTLANPQLDIKNEDAMPIMFYTNAGAGTLNNLRMFIDGTTGFIGMGLNFNTPVSVLHVNGINNATGNVFRTDAPNGSIVNWQMFRNNGVGVATQFGRLYNNNDNDFHIEATQGDGLIDALGVGATLLERMRFTSGTYRREFFLPRSK